MQRDSHDLLSLGRYTRACTALAHIEHDWLPADLYRHICELPKDHWGVHLCWCGCAFNDIGETFMQRPLPGFTEEQAA